MKETTVSKKDSLILSESGRISFFALIMSASCIFVLNLYLETGREAVQSSLEKGFHLGYYIKDLLGRELSFLNNIVIHDNNFFTINLTIILLLSIVFFASASYFIYALFYGGRNVSKSTVVRNFNSLVKLLQNSKSVVKTLENKMHRQIGSMRAETLDYLGICRKIIFSLEKRLAKVKVLIEMGASEELSTAAEMLEMQLDFKGSAMQDVVFESSHQELDFEIITANNCGQILERLFALINFDMQNIEESHVKRVA